MDKSLLVSLPSGLRGKATCFTLSCTQVAGHIFTFVTTRRWFYSATLFVFFLFSFVLNPQSFGQSFETPEMTKVTGGLILRSTEKSLSGRSNVKSESQKVRKSVQRVMLPGVRRLVPQEYPTIQAAIDASVDGDTVLVSEGTYLENIRYKGKAIVVGSYYLIDGDTTHISQTIINGSNSSHPDSGSVVYFIDGEDTTSALCGLTITGGSGTNYHWVSDQGHFMVRAGGGVLCDSSGAKLIWNNITRNRLVASCVQGGGLCAIGRPSFTPYLILTENRIKDNYVRNDTTDFWWCGGGGVNICGATSRIVGNHFERDTLISMSYADGAGLEIISFNWNTPPFPDAYIQNNVFRANIVTVTYYVGLGAGGSLFWTGEVIIQDNLFDGNTVSIEDYSGYAGGGGLYISNEYGTGFGPKMILRNRIINNCTNVGGGGGSDSNGGGIRLFCTLATVAGNEIADNSAIGIYSWGGGICMDWPSFHLENNIITRNYSSTNGGGVDVWQPPQEGTEQLLVNNTIYGNSANYGGGLAVTEGANVVALNNILWANTANTGSEVYVSEGIACIRYCDVQGGYTGEGNINADPQFADTLYHLLPSSPCIGMGRASITLGGTTYQAPPYDLEGNPRPNPIDTLVDMGVYETPFPARAQLVKSIINQGSPYIHPNQDSLRILLQILDPHQQGVSLTASMSNLQGAVWDEFSLFDDGQHRDSLANDNYFGAILPPVILEDAFRFNYYLVNHSFQDTLIHQEKQQITSIGPVVCQDYQILSQYSNRIQLQLVLHNLGQYSAATEVRAELIPLDSSVTGVIGNNRSFGDIPAGAAAVNSSAYIIDTIENPGIMSFDVKISMGGYPYWLQENLVVGIEPSEKQLPGEFALYQNYPNPFNPNTNIEFQIPKKEYVTLKIFNILGDEVETLVSGQLVAGLHSYEFDASNLASGVYFYRLQAGEFVQSRKMLVLR